MKKFFIAVLAIMGVTTAWAQTVNIHMKNGDVVRYESETVDYVDFSATSSEIDNQLNGHELADLGLSVRWATCNLGAETTEQPGDYYAWGETEPKDTYDADSYTADANALGKNISGTDYDPARAAWGATWRMPTAAEVKELNEKCTSEWTTENGVSGRRYTGPNGNSIFLPAVGYTWGIDLMQEGNAAFYATGTYYENSWGIKDNCVCLYFNSSMSMDLSMQFYGGYAIRPVTE